MRVKCLEVFKVVVSTCAMDAKQQRCDSRTKSLLHPEGYLPVNSNVSLVFNFSYRVLGRVSRRSRKVFAPETP